MKWRDSATERFSTDISMVCMLAQSSELEHIEFSNVEKMVDLLIASMQKRTCTCEKCKGMNLKIC